MYRILVILISLVGIDQPVYYIIFIYIIYEINNICCLRQQRNDGGGCAIMHERSERVESPGTYVTE